MAAASKVFATYELLEHILLELPLRHLLLAQHINKSCYSVGTRSSDIQQALFFQPATSKTIKWYIRGIGENDRSLFDLGRGWKYAEEGRTVVQPILNPFAKITSIYLWGLQAEPSKLQFLTETSPDMGTLRLKRSSDEGFVVMRKDCEQDPKDQSIRRMQVTHPPIRSICVEERELLYSPNRSEVANSEGVRMADLFAQVPMEANVQVHVAHLDGSGAWSRVNGTIDNITGVEMLFMLRLSDVARAGMEDHHQFNTMRRLCGLEPLGWEA